MAAIAGSSNSQTAGKKERKCFSKECTLTLTIPNFSAKKNQTDFIECKKSFHELGVGPEEDRFWAIQVRPFYRGRPNGRTRGDKKDYLSAFVSLDSKSAVRIHGLYRISIVGLNAMETMLEGEMALFDCAESSSCPWGYDAFTEHEVLSKSNAIKDDCLRVRADIRYSDVGPEDNFSANYLRELLRTGADSDMVMVSSDGEKFNVHKFQVGLQSTVLRRMIANLSKHEGKPKLKVDFNSDIIWAILKFLYGFSDWMPPTLDLLLTAAMKYRIMYLETECVEKLKAEMSMERAASLLKLAHDHSVDSLKEAVLEFIAEDIEEFTIVGGYEALASEKDILRDIRDACSERKSKKLKVAVSESDDDSDV